MSSVQGPLTRRILTMAQGIQQKARYGIASNVVHWGGVRLRGFLGKHTLGVRSPLKEVSKGKTIIVTLVTILSVEKGVRHP